MSREEVAQILTLKHEHPTNDFPLKWSLKDVGPNMAPSQQGTSD